MERELKNKPTKKTAVVVKARRVGSHASSPEIVELNKLEQALSEKRRDMAVMGLKLAALEQEWETMKSQHEALKMAHGALEQVHQDALIIMGALGDLFGIGPLNMALPRQLRMRITAQSDCTGSATMTVFGESFEVREGERAAHIQQKIDDIRKRQIKKWLDEQLTMFVRKNS
jgi:hypothetical protein